MSFAKVEPILECTISDHAADAMRRRSLDEIIVRQVLSTPEQREEVRPGRDVLQSRIDFEGATFVVRVFVDVDRKPAVVVTAYRSSKLGKYLRDPP